LSYGNFDIKILAAGWIGAVSQSHQYLICYDVSDSRRLRKVHRLIRDYARPLQYSVFITELSVTDITELWDKLVILIDPTEDRLHLLPLSGRIQTLSCGQGLSVPPLKGCLIMA
jgi:CRISPR-associated protein Cas2